MSIKIKELVKRLEKENQEEEVEFIVATTKGKMVCMVIERNANDLLTLLNLFSK